MSHHFLMIALLTTRFTLPEIYSAWLFPPGGGDLKFYAEGLYPQVKSLTYFFKKEKRAWEIEPIRVQSFLKGLAVENIWKGEERRRRKKRSLLFKHLQTDLLCLFSNECVVWWFKMAFALWWRKHCRFDTTNNSFIGRPFCLVHIKRGYTQMLYISCDLAIARIGMVSFCSVKKHETAPWTVLRPLPKL